MFGMNPFVTAVSTTSTPRELKRIYGANAVISRVDRYNLIHLDSPGKEEVRRRTVQFDADELFEDDCPLCRMLRGRDLDIIYLHPPAPEGLMGRQKLLM